MEANRNRYTWLNQATGETIREELTRQKLTIAQLARQTNQRRATISTKLNNQAVINLDDLQTLIEALNLPLDELVKRIENKRKAS